MSENQLEFTPIHCIFFIYHTFAAYTNGKIQDVEKNSIVQFMHRWTNDKNISTKIINDTLKWTLENIKNPQHAVSNMSSMIDHLKKQKQFNIYRREQLLLDIRNISRADGDFSDSEKKWHDMLAAQLDVHLRISDISPEDIHKENEKIERRPIGYKMSHNKK